MLSSQEEQNERRRVMLQDARLREQQQHGTMHAFAQSDAGTPLGRFSAISNAQVVGADPIPRYPAASAHQADPVGREPALGYRIDQMFPDGPDYSLGQDQGDAVVAPSSAPPVDDVEHTASPLSLGDPATEETAFPPQPGMVPKFRSPTPRRL